jgi:hypothetical protein
MHIENELVEYVSPIDQEYEQIVEEYEEEYSYRRGSRSHP